MDQVINQVSKIGEVIKKKPTLKNILEALGEVLMVLMLLIFAVALYFFFSALLISPSTFLKTFATHFSQYFGKILLSHFHLSIIILITLMIKKFLFKTKYRFSGRESRTLTIKILSGTLVEQFILGSIWIGMLYLAAHTSNMEFKSYIQTFTQNNKGFYLMAIILPIQSVVAALLNFILIRSFITPKPKKLPKREKKDLIVFSLLQGSILPVIHILWGGIITGGLFLLIRAMQIEIPN